MDKLSELSQRILDGKFSITEKFKYSMIIYPVSAVHLIYFIFFLLRKDSFMTFYNLASAIVYLLCTIPLHKEKYTHIYYVATVEIILNTIITTHMVGWDCGFYTFLFALTVAGYFISYRFTQHRLLTPMLGAGIGIIAYFCCYSYSRNHTALNAITDAATINALYVFNCICTFVFISVFSILFMLEMRVSQNKLFEENQMLGKIAGNDALTGLFNRWSMKTELEKAIESGNPFCLIMCDIDDFKKINDTYGHNCGDEVLKHIAGLISSSISKGNYVCRWGGEEFLILLNGYSTQDAEKLADKIRRTILASDTRFEDQDIAHTITMGIAPHQKNQTIDSLISRADTKLYIGKRQGKNIVIV